MKSTAELAYRAAAILAERGHCKGILSDGEGRVCFEGALRLAAGEPLVDKDPTEDSPAFVRSWSKVATAALKILDDRDFRVGPVSYNDQDETSAEDVILLLKECGARLESDEMT